MPAVAECVARVQSKMRFSDGLASSNGGTTYSLAEMTSKLSDGFASFLTAETLPQMEMFCLEIACTR